MAQSTEDREKFEQFLFEMDDVLEEFVGELKAAGTSLDYSLTSLGLVERWASANAALEDETQLNRIARYLGEVFRNVVGGRWALCTEPPNNLFYGLPVVSGHTANKAEFCPLEVVRNFAFSRRDGMLEQAVRAHIRPYHAGLSNGSTQPTRSA